MHGVMLSNNLVIECNECSEVVHMNGNSVFKVNSEGRYEEN